MFRAFLYPAGSGGAAAKEALARRSVKPRQREGLAALETPSPPDKQLFPSYSRCDAFTCRTEAKTCCHLTSHHLSFARSSNSRSAIVCRFVGA
jgi:hypothetical protein